MKADARARPWVSTVLSVLCCFAGVGCRQTIDFETDVDAGGAAGTGEAPLARPVHTTDVTALPQRGLVSLTRADGRGYFDWIRVRHGWLFWSAPWEDAAVAETGGATAFDASGPYLVWSGGAHVLSGGSWSGPPPGADPRVSNRGEYLSTEPATGGLRLMESGGEVSVLGRDVVPGSHEISRYALAYRVREPEGGGAIVVARRSDWEPMRVAESTPDRGSRLAVASWLDDAVRRAIVAWTEVEGTVERVRALAVPDGLEPLELVDWPIRRGAPTSRLAAATREEVDGIWVYVVAGGRAPEDSTVLSISPDGSADELGALPAVPGPGGEDWPCRPLSMVVNSSDLYVLCEEEEGTGSWIMRVRPDDGRLHVRDWQIDAGRRIPPRLACGPNSCVVVSGRTAVRLSRWPVSMGEKATLPFELPATPVWSGDGFVVMSPTGVAELGAGVASPLEPSVRARTDEAPAVVPQDEGWLAAMAGEEHDVVLLRGRDTNVERVSRIATEGPCRGVQLATGDGTSLVVWTELDRPAPCAPVDCETDVDGDVRAALLDADGDPPGTTVAVAPGSPFDYQPTVSSIAGGDFLVAWRSWPGGSVRRASLDGRTGEIIRGAADYPETSGAQSPALVRWGEGSYLTWRMSPGTDLQGTLRGRRLDADGDPVSEPTGDVGFQLDGHWVDSRWRWRRAVGASAWPLDSERLLVVWVGGIEGAREMGVKWRVVRYAGELLE